MTVNCGLYSCLKNLAILFTMENQSQRSYNKNNLIDAWHEIKNKLGNLIPGETKETLDGLPLKWFDDISDNLKRGTHRYAPSRQYGIPKPGKSGKKFLTIGSLRDKIIQRAFLRILQQIYEGLSTGVEADSFEHF